jgi:DNA sulfur modification protein DndD
MAGPLEEAFQEGFQLLSRKSDRLENVTIDPRTYQTDMKMRKFDGNWLDRDLSATERQHVGLSLLYALRKVGNRPIPVVVDTPTSRMDRDHKGWSVTRFYPALSHQVIVLATSDDLGDGLYDELNDSGALGLELYIEESTENGVRVNETNLSAFFGA